MIGYQDSVGRNLMFPVPPPATLARQQISLPTPPTISTNKKLLDRKRAMSQQKPVKVRTICIYCFIDNISAVLFNILSCLYLLQKRAGTIYVSCEYCKKDVSHSNIAAHIRKAHPERAKKKKERNRKKTIALPATAALTATKAATDTITAIKANKAITCADASVHNLETNPTVNSTIKGSMRNTSGCTGPRSKCPHCQGDFSRSHLSKHIKKKHPVEAVVDALVNRVVFETDFFQPFEPAGSDSRMSASLSATGPPSSTVYDTDSSSQLVHLTKKYKTANGYIGSIRGEGDIGRINSSDSGEEDADRTENDEQRQARKRRESVTAVCKYCNVVITKKHMIVHMRKMHPEKLHMVEESIMRASEQGSTSGFRERSDKYPTVACNYCGKEITKKSIRAHVRNLHPEAIIESATPSGMSGAGHEAPLRPLVSCPTTQCKYCLKTITKKSIRAHVRNLHPEAAVEEVLAAASKALEASGSGTEFSHPGGDMAAGFLHTVNCHYCHMKIPATEILNHVRISHERTTTTPCKYCPKHIQNRNMNTHVRKYHIVESVVEVLVSKVVSLNETQPAQLNCRLPVSRLHSINALSSSGGSLNHKFTLPFSTQRELDERDAMQLRELEEVATTGFATNVIDKHCVVPRGSKGGHKRSIPNCSDSGVTKKGRKSVVKSSGGNVSDNSSVDFSNLYLLAAFASTMQPLTI